MKCKPLDEELFYTWWSEASLVSVPSFAYDIYAKFAQKCAEKNPKRKIKSERGEITPKEDSPPKLTIFEQHVAVKLWKGILLSTGTGTGNQSSGETPNNIIFSPLLIQLMMAVVQMGARGQTATELAKIMSFPKNSLFMETFPTILEQFYECCKFGWGIFYDCHHFNIKRNSDNIRIFTSSSETCAGTGTGARIQSVQMIPLDLKRSKLKVAHILNEWAAKISQNKISSLDLDPPFPGQEERQIEVKKEKENYGKNSQMTSLILVTVLTLELKFQLQFSLTEELVPFYHDETGFIPVHMMRVTSYLHYGVFPDLKARAISLAIHTGQSETNFQGHTRYTMIIVLPDSKIGVKELEQNLGDNFFQDIQSRLAVDCGFLVEVKMPQFTFSSQTELTPVLKKMGLRSLFTRNMDLSGFFERCDVIDYDCSSSSGSGVSRIIQKCQVKVTPEGVFTQDFMQHWYQMSCRNPETTTTTKPTVIPFHVDRPFLFYILDLNTFTVILAGKKVSI